MAGFPVTLFLVDDDDVEAELVQRSLKKSRIANEIFRARDGREALSMLRGQNDAKIPKPFVILLDLNMPRMNGFEFLDELRADPELENTIVFVLSTSNAEDDKSAAYNRNIAGYIVKSNAGRDFTAMLDMIEHYWKIVEFPAVD